MKFEQWAHCINYSNFLTWFDQSADSRTVSIKMIIILRWFLYSFAASMSLINSSQKRFGLFVCILLEFNSATICIERKQVNSMLYMVARTAKDRSKMQVGKWFKICSRHRTGNPDISNTLSIDQHNYLQKLNNDQCMNICQ